MLCWKGERCKSLRLGRMFTTLSMLVNSLAMHSSRERFSTKFFSDTSEFGLLGVELST